MQGNLLLEAFERMTLHENVIADPLGLTLRDRSQ
jgi:hypothetical protein